MADILVIDDDRRMRRMLVRILNAAGHTVSEAVDGRHGIELFREAPPMLVITDIVMPEIEGIETIQKLRIEAPTIPILAISGNARHGYLRFAQRLGATATLAKPFSAEELVDAVTRLLEEATSMAG